MVQKSRTWCNSDFSRYIEICEITVKASLFWLTVLKVGVHGSLLLYNAVVMLAGGAGGPTLLFGKHK